MFKIKAIAHITPRSLFAGSVAVLGCALVLWWALPAAVHTLRVERGVRALEEARAFAEEHPGQANEALDRAVSLLQRAAGDAPADGYAYRRLGQAYLLLGDNQRAAEALLRATELRPDHPLIHVELGYAYDGLGRAEAALAAYELGRFGPAVEAAIVNYIKVADWKMGAGAGDQALGILEKALALDPDSLPALYRSMIIYRGISEQANAEFAEPLRLRLQRLSRKTRQLPNEPRLAAYTDQTIAHLIEEGIWTADPRGG